MSRHGGLDEYRPKMICFYFNSDHMTQEYGTRLRKAVKEAISVPTESVDFFPPDKKQLMFFDRHSMFPRYSTVRT